MPDIVTGTGESYREQSYREQSYREQSYRERGRERERERLLESLESYRRGRSDAPLLRKWSGGALARAGGGGGAGAEAGVGAGEPAGGPVEADGAELPMTFVISSEEVDRHGDVVVAQGWRLAAYRQNPVFLWAHDYTRPVIGRARAVWPEAERLLARMEFAPTDFAREVAALYRSGYQQGVSVGFKPLRYEERRQEQTGAFLGLRFLEQELLEVSAVPVPANRQALRRAGSREPAQLPGAGDCRCCAYWAGAPGPEEEVSPGLAEALAELRASW